MALVEAIRIFPVEIRYNGIGVWHRAFYPTFNGLSRFLPKIPVLYRFLPETVKPFFMKTYAHVIHRLFTYIQGETFRLSLRLTTAKVGAWI